MSQTQAEKWNHYLELMKKASLAAETVLNQHFGQLKNVEEKWKAGLVSEADREAEQAIVQVLQSETPEFSILAEESGVHEGEASHQWIIDPLDGTTNYIHRLPMFAICIALKIDGAVRVGSVQLPHLNKLYTAIEGQGAYLNNQPIHVSKNKDLHNSLFATGYAGVSGRPDALQATGRVLSQTRGIRRMGSAAIDLCFVAEGIFDGFWEEGLQPWDIAAGALIVQEAGGRVSDFANNEFRTDQKSTCAANPDIHPQLLNLL